MHEHAAAKKMAEAEKLRILAADSLLASCGHSCAHLRYGLVSRGEKRAFWRSKVMLSVGRNASCKLTHLPHPACAHHRVHANASSQRQLSLDELEAELQRSHLGCCTVGMSVSRVIAYA